MKKAAALFRQMFFGLSSEQAFLNGLNVDELGKKLPLHLFVTEGLISFYIFNRNTSERSFRSECFYLIFVRMEQNSATWIRLRNNRVASFFSRKKRMV